MDEELVNRAEVVTLLFKVSDIAASLERIELLLREEDDDGEEEADED